MPTSEIRSQTDVVVQGIREMIVRGELVAGRRLSTEKELAARFSVSRGSLREGIRALAHLGVLETRQGSGTYVTALDPSLLLAPLGFVADLQSDANVWELQAVRRVLETASIRATALHASTQQLQSAQVAIDAGASALADSPDYETAMEADQRFHQELADASGNRVLASLIGALGGRTVRARLWRAMLDEHAADRAVHEHQEILDAVSARDPEAAAVRMAAHLLSVETFLRRPRPFDPTAPTSH